MDLKALLPRRHVVFHLPRDSRRDMLTALAKPLLASGEIQDLDTFVSDVEQREDRITTQIGRLLAIPHARSATVRRLGLAVGFADAPGALFNPQAAAPCRCLFLIAIPMVSPTAHLQLLRLLVQFAQDPRRIERILTAHTPGPVVAALAGFRARP